MDGPYTVWIRMTEFDTLSLKDRLFETRKVLGNLREGHHRPWHAIVYDLDNRRWLFDIRTGEPIPDGEALIG